MELEIAALCDGATEQHGKLNILGTFDRLRVSKFPFMYPLCFIVFRLRFHWNEQGRHELKVNFIDADGQPIIPSLESTLDIRIDPGRESTVANVILMLQRLTIKEPGLYAIDMLLNGSPEKSLPLTVETSTTST